MISLILGIAPWTLWAALGLIGGGGALTFLRSGNRLSGTALKIIGGLAMCIVALMLFRSALGSAKAEGVRQERESWQKLADEYKALKAEAAQSAEETRQEGRARSEAVAETHLEKNRRYYAARPDERDSIVFDGDRVREIRAARAAVASAAIRAAGGGTDAGSRPSGSSEGRLDEGPGG